MRISKVDKFDIKNLDTNVNSNRALITIVIICAIALIGLFISLIYTPISAENTVITSDPLIVVYDTPSDTTD